MELETWWWRKQVSPHVTKSLDVAHSHGPVNVSDHSITISLSVDRSKTTRLIERVTRRCHGASPVTTTPSKHKRC
jgi:hypothetical protein